MTCVRVHLSTYGNIVKGCSHRRDEGNLVAFNEENKNKTEGTLVAFVPGVEASSHSPDEGN
jgi:hypothetical protein